MLELLAPRRLLLVLLALVPGVVALSASSAPARAEQNGPVAAAALRQLGTHGGQCWTFMQQIVAEATGRQVGYDYRLGFFEAGAVEVSPDAAVNGDIIQIASDANTAPSASYAGLHTAIVLKNLGGNRFDAVDSNQNWDEMVQLRPNYDPYAAAARYGLQVHIYRIPGGGTGGTPAPGVPDLNLTIGAHAIVAADPDCLNVRSSAGLGGARVGCLRSGVAVKVIDGPITKDGYTWVRVSSPAGSGWVATRFLVAADPATAGGALPEPAASPAEPVSPAGEVVPAAVPAAPVGRAAIVDNSPGCLRVRGSTGLLGAILACLPAGTAVTVLEDSAAASDGYEWSRISVAGPIEGWVASKFLIRQ